ncbi:guanine nucleotide exchange factor MSS4 homolog [Belonocnema kinseyi]|uniref:guanine nucleotide exchange factor MSS4 homolog n=1 Tax=Belonocnema kinseyi TaxID=2817044 RepID=UPI00143DE8A2|nr:guanine nucleotide exchange factor MSS4 homolog [Belonocnema kinseyi]
MALVEERKDSSGRNADVVYCTFCPSKILNSGAAAFVNIEFVLPEIMCKKGGEADKREPISDYWMVEDINCFENIGVSHTVDNVKYLACADCERGPVGWHDVSTCKSYIALSRVKHEKPSSQKK